MDSSTRNQVLHCDISHYLIRKQNVKLEDFITAIRESYIGKVNYLRNLEIIIFLCSFGNRYRKHLWLRGKLEMFTFDGNAKFMGELIEFPEQEKDLYH